MNRIVATLTLLAAGGLTLATVGAHAANRQTPDTQARQEVQHGAASSDAAGPSSRHAVSAGAGAARSLAWSSSEITLKDGSVGAVLILAEKVQDYVVNITVFQTLPDPSGNGMRTQVTYLGSDHCTTNCTGAPITYSSN